MWHYWLNWLLTNMQISMRSRLFNCGIYLFSTGIYHANKTYNPAFSFVLEIMLIRRFISHTAFLQCPNHMHGVDTATLQELVPPFSAGGEDNRRGAWFSGMWVYGQSLGPKWESPNLQLVLSSPWKIQPFTTGIKYHFGSIHIFPFEPSQLHFIGFNEVMSNIRPISQMWPKEAGSPGTTIN